VGDIIKERAELFIASRLKRLAERMQSDAARVLEKAGVSVHPGQFSVLAALDRYGPHTVGQLADAMQLSQPAITRMVAKLTKLGLLAADREHKDQRHKTVRLTKSGIDALDRAKLHVWPVVEKSVVEVLQGLNGPFLDQIAAIESRLEEKSLDKRAQAASITIEIADPLSPELATLVAELDTYLNRVCGSERNNGAPIETLFQGEVTMFVARHEGRAIGCAGFEVTGNGFGEVKRMYVVPSYRGKNAGRLLLAQVENAAREAKVRVLQLETTELLPEALGLYKKMGFVPCEAFGLYVDRPINLYFEKILG
jgi:DNA-binding MarR family transcriptional regulator